MNRRTDLYLNGARADLSDTALILMNHTFSDVASPAAVKNSYSKQVTLPETPVNAAALNFAGRTDRITPDGGFSPLKRAPFVIQDAATGATLERGYFKVDSFTPGTGWKITLYGGLGSFFHILSEGADGAALTLADLDYTDAAYVEDGGVADPEGAIARELDFTISKEAVTGAWRQLAGEDVSELWDVINFAPCYNGIPDAGFDPGRALHSGKFIKLAKDCTEWDAKDLRSYMQRPVLSMAAFMEAVKRKAKGAGITFDYSGAGSGFFSRLWLTRPLLTSLKQAAASVDDAEMTFASGTSAAKTLGVWTPAAGIPPAAVQTAELTCYMHFYPAENYSGLSLSNGNNRTVFVMQVRAGGVYSEPKVYAPAGTPDLKTAVLSVLQNSGKWTPKGGHDFPTAVTDISLVEETGADTPDYFVSNPFTASLETTGATVYDMLIDVFTVNTYNGSVSPRTFPMLYHSGGYIFQQWTGGDNDGEFHTLSWQTPETPRSGSEITKADILTSGHTPAEYLTGLAKLFGLVFTYDPALRRVEMIRRTNFFTGEEWDLSEILDTSRGTETVPLLAASRYYDMTTAPEGGAFAEDYEKTTGRVYGSQRTDTGYEFEDTPAEILEGVPYRGAAAVLESTRYNNTITDGNGTYIPSLFTDEGNTYEDDGSAVPRPPSGARVTYFNALHGYDMQKAPKAQLHGADGKPAGGEDVLLHFARFVEYPHFKVSDDAARMVSGGNDPCWDITPPDGDALSVPVFSRYTDGADDTAQASLDPGTPQRIGIPGYSVPEEASLYHRYWRAWLADRFDKDTLVLKCRCRLDGFTPGQELLRRFWHYGGSIWVLNSIRNWSLTTGDPAECEFIRVHDKEAYTGED